MKHLIQLFKSELSLLIAVTTILVIGLSTILHSPSSSANDSRAPFSISGNLHITHITDGDSLRSGKVRIRLFGVDAPERKQNCTNLDGRQSDCGIAAQKALTQLVKSVSQISCDLMDVDRYSRLVMRCFAGETDAVSYTHLTLPTILLV